MSSLPFLFIFAFVSGLLSNTVIMLLLFMSLKVVTNNQPQVWISDHKLLAFGGFTLQSSQLSTKMCIFSICNFISLYLIFKSFH